jgi:hypothetical protein
MYDKKGFKKNQPLLLCFPKEAKYANFHSKIDANSGFKNRQIFVAKLMEFNI